MSISNMNKKEPTFLFNNLNPEENIKKKSNFIFNKTNNIKKEYKKTNINYIQNKPILKQDCFQEVLNKYNRYKANNNIPLYNNKNDKIITIKLNLEGMGNKFNKSDSNFDSNNFQDSGDINSIKTENFEIPRIDNEVKNSIEYLIPKNKDKKIEIINIQTNFPEENSYNNSSNLINNTIKSIEHEDEDNMNFPFPNINNTNNIFLDNNLNTNTILDIYNISENNNSNNLDLNKNSGEIFVTFNKNNQNQNQNEFPIPIPPKQNIGGYSPLQISSFDSKKDIFSSNSNINKDNFLSPINNEISPLLKILNKNNSNEINIKNNFSNINININNNGNNLHNLSIFSKNTFEPLNSFMQQKDNEFIEKYGMTPYEYHINNMKYNSNKKILENWHKMAGFLKQKNQDYKIVNENNNKYIINLLLKKLHKNNIFDSNNFNPAESSTKIITNVEVKPLYNSSDNITDDDNYVNNNNSNGIRIINNVKEIPQDNENEYAYEPTNLSFIMNTNFRKILDENKLMKLFGEMEELDKIKTVKKNQIMEAIKEEDDEYQNDSAKISRKNSFTKSKISKNDEYIKIKNSYESLDKININMKNKESNKNSNNDLSPKKEKINHLSYSSNNLDINEKYSTPYNFIKSSEIINKNSIKDEDISKNEKEKEIKYVEIPDFSEFFDANKINENNNTLKNINSYKITNPKEDNKIVFTSIEFQQQFKKIDEYFKNNLQLNKEENKDINQIENNTNIDLNLKNSLSSNIQKQSNYLFDNIFKNDNNTNNNYNNDDDFNNLFKKPYQSLNINNENNMIPQENQENKEKSNKNIKSNNYDLNQNSHDENIKDDIYKDENNINNNELSIEQKNDDNIDKDKMINNNEETIDNTNKNQINNLFNTENYIIDNNNLYNPFNSKNKNNQDKNTIENNINSNKNINYNINNEQIENNINLNEEHSNKSKKNELLKIKDNGIDNYIFYKNENKETDVNLNKDKQNNNFSDNRDINKSSINENKENIENNKNNENEKNNEYDFDIDEDEYNELIKNSKNALKKNNKNEIEKPNNNSSNNKENNENEINNNEYKNDNNYKNEFKNESCYEGQNKNNINNFNIINDEEDNNENNNEDNNIDNNSNNYNNSEKLGKDEKIIFNSDDKNDFNIYIESPFNTPIKTNNNTKQTNNLIFNNKDNINNINLNLFDSPSSTSQKKSTNRKLTINQINKLKNFYLNFNLNINNDDHQIDNFLNYYIKKNNNLLFSKTKNIIKKKYKIPLKSYLLILNKICSKQKLINKINYETLIKKLINLTNYHKNKIIDISNINNDNNNITEEKKELLEIVFKNFRLKIKELKYNYNYYLNKKKYYINDKNKMKELENKVDIQKRRDEMKNTYKDLIKYMNNIYKNNSDKKRIGYQKVIDYLKEYEKLDENMKMKMKMNENKYNMKNKELKNDNKNKEKEFRKKFAIGAVLIPLFYLVNFFYSNFK